jgi:hypothetical protein
VESASELSVGSHRIHWQPHWRPLRVLGVSLAALSIVAVVEHWLALDLGPALQFLLNYYELGLQALFQWAERLVLNWLGPGLTLSPDWKHLFIVVLIFFGADAGAQFAAVGNRWANAFWGLVSGICGIVFAFASSVTAGAVSSSLEGSWTAFGPTLLLVACFTAFWLVNLARDAARFGWHVHFMDSFSDEIRVGLSTIGLGVAVLAIAYFVGGEVRGYRLPALWPIGLYLTAVGVYFGGRSLSDWIVLDHARSYPGVHDPEGRAGANFLVALAVATAVLALDALLVRTAWDLEGLIQAYHQLAGKTA